MTYAAIVCVVRTILKTDCHMGQIHRLSTGFKVTAHGSESQSLGDYGKG